MKKNFGTQLTRSEMKNVLGGSLPPPTYCGSQELNGCCNAYCDTTGCSGTCSKCEDAGNGDGGDGKHKICYQFRKCLCSLFNRRWSHFPSSVFDRSLLHIKKLIFMPLKWILFFASYFILTNCKSQSNFILNGIVNGRDTGYIVLRYTDNTGKWINDTTYLQNGKFKFEGKITEPTLAVIKGYRKIIDFNEVNFTNIYIEPGEQKIILTENDYEHAKVEGSLTQKEFDTFHIHIDSINAKYKNLDQQLLKAKYAYEDVRTEADKKKALQREAELSDKLTPRINEVLNEDIDFVIHHPDSYASAYVIFMPLNSLPVDSAEVLFDKLSSRVKSSWDGKDIADMIRKKKQNRLGNMAYDFKAIDAKGNNISLSNFEDKYVLLDFWASWCKPCRAAIPHLKELYSQCNSHGFEILTISIDEDSAAWKKAIAQEKIDDWNNVLANKDINDNYDNTHQAIPTQILVGPQGKVVWTWQSDESLDEVLKKFIH